jgi:tripartite-type tricarboxylate transporter receptor subunit TctC
MTTSTTRRLRRLAAATACWPLAGPALAQEAWPTKPVRMVVPFAPAAPPTWWRAWWASGWALWGQPVVVENRAGAGGNVGADVVAKSPATATRC